MPKFIEWSDIDMHFRKSASGEIAIARDEDAINQSIKILLSTMEGERVRSSIGSSLFDVLFEPMSKDSAEEIQSIIQTNIERYETRIIIQRVRVLPDFNSHYYEISIDYRMLPSQKKKNLTTFMPAMGEF